MCKQSLRCDFATFLNVVVALSSTMAIPAYTLRCLTRQLFALDEPKIDFDKVAAFVSNLKIS